MKQSKCCMPVVLIFIHKLTQLQTRPNGTPTQYYYYYYHQLYHRYTAGKTTLRQRLVDTTRKISSYSHSAKPQPSITPPNSNAGTCRMTWSATQLAQYYFLLTYLRFVVGTCVATETDRRRFKYKHKN